MAKIQIALEFDSIDEMLEVFGGRLPDRVTATDCGGQPAGAAPEAVATPPASGQTVEESVFGPNRAASPPAPPSPPTPAEQRKRRAFLQHPDGRVIETLDPLVVDAWMAEGASHITKARYDQGAAAAKSEPAHEPEPPAESVTFDVVRDTVRRVNAAKGLDALLSLLTEFNAERVSEVREADYSAFLARAQAVVDG